MLRKMLVVASVACLGLPLALHSVAAEAKPPSNVPGAEPYQTTVKIVVPDTYNVVAADAPVPVPADRRLVVESVSVRFLIGIGDNAIVAIYGNIGGAQSIFYVPLTLGSTSAGYDDYRGTHMMRIYHDGDGVRGPQVQCVRYTSGTGQAYCDVTISGYLIGM